MCLKIDDRTYSTICALCKSGDEYAERKDFEQAIQNYDRALELVPEPFWNYEASTWILTAIGEAYFFLGDYEKARSALQDTMHCPGAVGNPFVHLRLGQVQFELENFSRAGDELARAYMIEGKTIFEDEADKYFNFLKTLLKNVPEEDQ